MTQQQASFKLIKGKYVVDGKGGTPLEQGAVLLEGTKIRAIDAQHKLTAPEGASVEVFDFPDGTILPGLIDVHTHLNYPGDGTHTNVVMEETEDILLMQSIVNARKYLNLGVTAIRDNGAKNNTTRSLKEGIRRNLATGPRLQICVNPLTITGGHMWQMGAEADGVDAVIAMTRKMIKLGADYIKIAVTGGSTLGTYPTLPAYNVDELRAISYEAHKFQRLVAAHAHASEGIRNALDAEIDMIIHCTWREPDGSSAFPEALCERIVRQGAWVNPTLQQIIGAPRDNLHAKADTVGLTPPEQARMDGLDRAYPLRLEQIQKMSKLGVKFVTGTDCGWGEVPFNQIHKEMEIFVKSGMSPMQAVVSATRDAADSMGIGNIVGTLEEGKEADVAVFNGAPHQDVNDIVNVAAVFQAGLHVV